MKKQYYVIRSKGEFVVKAENNIYELNLKTGMILKAEMKQEGEKEGMKVFRLTEKSLHLYMPAYSKEQAKIKFNSVLNSTRKGRK